MAAGVDKIDAQELLRRADTAMYDAKHAGKGSFAVFGDQAVQDDVEPLDGARSLEPATS